MGCIKFNIKICQCCGNSCVIVAGLEYMAPLFYPLQQTLNTITVKIRFKSRTIFMAAATVVFADPQWHPRGTQTTNANSVEAPTGHHHITASLSQLCLDDGKKKHPKRKNKKKKHQYFTNSRQKAGSRTEASRDPTWNTDTPLQLLGT